MPLFRPNRVVLQPIFYMFTRCMLCKENRLKPWKISLSPWKTQWTPWKNRWTLWVNQWTPRKNRVKPWKNRWTVQMASFSFKIQQSTGFCVKMWKIARKSAPDWKKQKIRSPKKYAPFINFQRLPDISRKNEFTLRFRILGILGFRKENTIGYPSDPLSLLVSTYFPWVIKCPHWTSPNH